MQVTRNTIQSFQGSHQSGIAILVFQEGNSTFADNGPLGRILNDLAQSVRGQSAIGEGHVINSSPIQGIEIVWWEAEFGLILEGFVTYDDWLEKGLPELDPAIATEVDFADYQ